MNENTEKQKSLTKTKQIENISVVVDYWNMLNNNNVGNVCS